MPFLDLFKDKCPTCGQALKHDKSKVLSSLIIKYCPNGHYEKEYHPAYESFIETIKK